MIERKKSSAKICVMFVAEFRRARQSASRAFGIGLSPVSPAVFVVAFPRLSVLVDCQLALAFCGYAALLCGGVYDPPGTEPRFYRGYAADWRRSRKKPPLQSAGPVALQASFQYNRDQLMTALFLWNRLGTY
ncbi:MAG TPA: hypothetical protein VFC63_00925 [Blastocatellia bacterium]|nr:hypothetical protein [Blastocatellia bacterium]